jgi:acyl carrier protein
VARARAPAGLMQRRPLRPTVDVSASDPAPTQVEPWGTFGPSAQSCVEVTVDIDKSISHLRGEMHDDPYALLVRLLRQIAPEVDLDEVDRAEPLQDAADLDSMDFLNLMSALYTETGIEVPERDYPAVASIDGFVSYVRSAAAIGRAR